MAERIVEANGVELCTESFRDPADPPILLTDLDDAAYGPAR